jgi:lipid II:glycine glycyltransferase (peptidoglycan interpeptide bridge formation enzyme)
MTLLRKEAISIAEVWFDEEFTNMNFVDLVYYLQRTHPIEKVRSQEFYTILVDLTKSEDNLWKNIHGNNRYKIRRAEKDKVTYQFLDCDRVDAKLVNDFSETYDSFALEKGLSKIKRSRLMQYAEAKLLNISTVQLPEDSPLVWHVYYRGENRVRLLHSASIKKNGEMSSIIGRANRFLHWQDILKFKTLGIITYDLGGWYEGNTDQERLNINKFKEEFGGEIVKNFNQSYATTMKGKLYLLARKMRRL